MIDKQVIQTMSAMLSMIKKFAKNAYPEVETKASEENRRRAWVITGMLARLAEHAAKSDLEALLSDDVQRTYSEREKYAHAAKQSIRALMLELHEFKKTAKDYKNRPVEGEDRTDGDIVRSLEILRPQCELLRARREDFAFSAGLRLCKEAEKYAAEQLAAAEEKLKHIEEKLAASEALADSRKIVVSFNKYRTVIEKVADGAKLKNCRIKATQTTKTTDDVLVV